MTQIVNVHIGLAAWSSSTYVLGDRRSNAGNAYQCITAGSSTAAPTGTGSSINNGGAAVWKWLSAIDLTSGDLRFSTTTIIPATPTQPVLVYFWNDGLITATSGVSVIWLTGHTTSSTNTITVMPAPGDGFAATYLASPATALAYSAANGLAIQCPASGVGSVNYIQIDDNNVILRGLQIKDPNATSGSTLIGGNGTNIAIQKCILDGFAQTGGAVLVQLQHGLTFTNNLVVGRNTTVGGPVIQAGNVTGVVVANNTFVHLTNISGQTVLDGASNPTSGSNKAENNIFINYDAPYQSAITTCWLTDHNFYTAASFLSTAAATDTGGSVYGITTAATFAAFSTNFNLKAGSAALNAGVTDTADIPAADDIVGNARPQGSAWDGGCAELLLSFAVTLSDTVTTSSSLIPASGTLGYSQSIGSPVNILTNSAGAGGVVGTPGTLPTDWVIRNTPGLSSQVVATTSGSFTDVRFFGTSTGGDLNFTFDQTFVTAQPSTTYTMSVGMAMTAGSLANIANVDQGMDSLDGSGGYISSGGGRNNVLTGSVQTFSSSMVSDPATGKINAHFSLAGTSAGAVDITLRLQNPQVTGFGSDTAVTTDAFVLSSITNYSQSLGNTTATSDALTIAALGYSAGLNDTVATATSQSTTGYGLALPVELASSSDTLTALAGAFSGVLGDTVATSSLAQSQVFATLADTITASDNLTGVLASIANPFTDEFAVDFGAGTSPTNPFVNIFTIEFGAGATQPVLQVETAATSDTVSGITVAVATLTDTAATGDAFTFNASVTWTDAAITSESLTGVLAITGLSQTDSASTSDSLSPVSGAVAGLSDSLAASETLSLGGTGVPLADTGVTSDSLTGIGAAFAAPDVSTAVTSETLSLIATTQSLSDSAATGDSITLGSGYAVSLSDTVATTETLTPAVMALTGSLTNSAATAETLLASLAATAALADSFTGSDSATTGGYGLPLTDSLAGSDSTSATGIGGTAQSDSAASSDGFVLLVSGYAASLGETASTSETLTPAPIAVTGTLSETANTSDALTPAGVARTATLSDNLATTEQYNLVTYLAVAGDTLTIGETQSALGTAVSALADALLTGDGYSALTLLDSAAISETLSGQAAGFQSFLNALLSGDILLSVRGFVTSLADAAVTGDSFALQNSGYGLALADSLVLSEAWTSIGVGSPLMMTAMVIPTGGAVLLEFPGYFPVLPRAVRLTISRSVVNSSIWTVIYDGPPVGVFLDVGDGTPRPLDPATGYLWRAADYSGITTTGPLTPASTFINQPDQLTQILIRALQGAINSMTLPAGIQRPQITIKMPMNGWQAMPFIVVNVDLIQQTEVEIGEDVVNPTPDNNWTLFANARRVWRVTIMSQDAEERDFYRDSLLAVFRVLKATAFGPAGLNVSHTFQAVSYSSAQEWEGVSPSFYGADLMLEINGIFPAAVLTDYPVILRIESNPTYLPDTFVINLEPVIT